MNTLEVSMPIDKDESDIWMSEELERARIEFTARLEALLEQYAKKKFGKLGEQVARQITVNVGIEISEK